MNHLGDITKISGQTAPIVDCIIGGSPCQDLSVAGKRAGLDGERSGLFMEQIRIIKEMRESDRRNNGRTGVNVRPRYMVWENVPGAFSSNKGEDFRVVLEETAKIAEESVSIPRPEKGKWANAGCIRGDGWSIAWRVFDAQFWGVPQRRRRIALVADFGGQSASEILFVRKSLSGDSEQGKQKRKEAPSDASGGIGTGDIAFTMQDREGKDGGGKGALIQEDRATSLRTNNYMTVFQPCNWDGSQVSPTLTANNAGGSQRMPDKDNFNCVLQPVSFIDGWGGNMEKMFESDKMNTVRSAQPQVIVDKVVYDARGNGDGKTAPTMTGDHQNRVTDYTGVVVQPYRKQGHPRNSEEGQGWEESDKSDTLNVFDNSETRTPTIVVAMDRASYNQGKNAKYDPQFDEKGVAFAETARGPGAVAYAETVALEGNGQRPSHKGDGYAVTDKNYTLNTTEVHGVAYEAKAVDLTNLTESDVNGALQACMAHNTHSNNVVRIKYIVRRLTPMECERLQGYPDGWTDIGDFTDTKGKKCKTSDAARYKALGNSIALPSWRWVIKRLCGCYERPATMASLFDGIGGFPLIWEQFNGKGSCLWASEIEEFPIAVTKRRINNEST